MRRSDRHRYRILPGTGKPAGRLLVETDVCRNYTNDGVGGVADTHQVSKARRVIYKKVHRVLEPGIGPRPGYNNSRVRVDDAADGVGRNDRPDHDAVSKRNRRRADPAFR